jgi:hypothetical protein
MCRAPSTAVDDSLWRGVDLGSSLTACKLKKVILCAMNFCCAPGPRPVRSIFFMRQAPDGSSREERQASGPWHHPSGSGRPAGRYCNRICRGGALARPKVVPRSQKWACRLPEGSTRRAHRVGPIGAKRYHALTWNLSPPSHRFYWFCEWRSAAKNSLPRLRLGMQAATRVV